VHCSLVVDFPSAQAKMSQSAPMKAVVINGARAAMAI
jgi:hypothetical protein